MRRFVFTPFGSRVPTADGTTVISCDGLVEAADLHLSHWDGNRTPLEWKRDTSTESALDYAESRRSPDGESKSSAAELVTNNHFDADGALSIFALIDPDTALAHRALLVAAAEAGDFDAWPSNPRGLELEASIRAIAGPSEDEDAYERVLGSLGSIVTNLEARDDLWGEEWEALHREEELAARTLAVSRHGSITLFEGSFEPRGPILDKRASRDSTRWLTAIDRGHGRFDYRYERPRWAWADTVDRPKVGAPVRGPIVDALGKSFSAKAASGMTAILGTMEPVSLSPRELVSRLLEADAGAR
ncbi:MAG: hypothetical protein HY791_23330 [Deltaproteobacteria bacterium]|nr:hypothetical protein [Deltaproteobacteria bacterium]